jgi:hypothetical protein
MSKGKEVILCMMAVLIIIPLSSLKAEYITDTRETLRGIKDILVVVKIAHQETQEYGLARDVIQKDVVSQLEQAGIEVIPLKAFPTLNPYLFIEAKTSRSEHDLFVYSLLIAFKQIVYMPSNPDLSVDAITWSETTAGAAHEKELGKAILSSIKDSVDIFINDYLAVNPGDANDTQGMKSNSSSSEGDDKSKTHITDRRGEGWDITQAVSIGFKPENFQFGLGRDAFKPLDDTNLKNDTSKTPSDLRIIGIAGDADSQAYSIPKLTGHEIANTTMGSEPIAAAY